MPGVGNSYAIPFLSTQQAAELNEYWEKVKAFKTANQVRLYTMAQTVGTVIKDYSPNNSTGGAISGVSLGVDTQPNGFRASYWDGVNDFIDFGTDLESDYPAKDKGTIVYWFKVPTWAPLVDGRFFDIWTSTGDYIRLSNKIGANTAQFVLRSSATSVAFSENTVKSVDTYYQYIVSWDYTIGASSFMDVYLNGSRVFNNVGAKLPFTGTWDACRIGTNRTNTSTAIEMTMGIAGIWDTSITPAEALDLYTL